MSPYLLKKKIEERQKRNLVINISFLVACFVLFILNLFVVNTNKDLLCHISASAQEIKGLEAKNEILTLEISNDCQLDDLAYKVRRASFIPPQSIIWLKVQPGILVERLSLTK